MLPLFYLLKHPSIYQNLFSSSSSLFIVPSLPCLGADVIWAASTVLYSLPYLLWCLTLCLLPLVTLLKVFFGLHTGLLPSTSSSIALLSMLFSSLRFTLPNHLNLIFLNLCSRFFTPYLLLTSSLVNLSCFLLTCISVNILWSQLASFVFFLYFFSWVISIFSLIIILFTVLYFNRSHRWSWQVHLHIWGRTSFCSQIYKAARTCNNHRISRM